jgi:hypothetical protein
MAQVENLNPCPAPGADMNKATANKFLQELAHDYKQAKNEYSEDRAAQQQDVQDGKLAHTLLNQLSHGQLHVANQALFRAEMNRTLHNAHRDLSLEPQYERDTQTRANTELSVMHSLSHTFGLKMPDLTITNQADSSSPLPKRAIDADRSNAMAELSGDISARTSDQQDINASNHLTAEGQKFLDIPGIQAMFSALQKERSNSQQDIGDEHLYQHDAQTRANLDLLAGAKVKV